jgi:plastocyanin
VRFGASAAVALVIVASAACDNTTTGSGTSNSVTVGDNYFAPTPDTVSVGDSVLFVWAGSTMHDILGLNNNAVWCTQRAGGFCYVKFLTVGSFPYYCSYHGEMQAAMVVK